MKRGWLMALISANLAVLIALVFIYPHLMVSPGPVVAAHAELNTDCFACHAPLRGASTERCIACHALPDIGLRSSKGVPLVRKAKGVKTSFHQELIEKNCMACHSDHQAPRLTQRSRKPFARMLALEHLADGAARQSRGGSCRSRNSRAADALQLALGLADARIQPVLQGLGGNGVTVAGHDEGHRRLAPLRRWHADHRRLGHGGVFAAAGPPGRWGRR
jgi:hypothetical protein